MREEVEETEEAERAVEEEGTSVCESGGMGATEKLDSALCVWASEHRRTRFTDPLPFTL